MRDVGLKGEVEVLVVVLVVVTVVAGGRGWAASGVVWYHRLIAGGRSRVAGPDIVSHTHTHTLRITW